MSWKSLLINWIVTPLISALAGKAVDELRSPKSAPKERE